MPSSQSSALQRAAGIGLVGEPDLDVLGIARDPRLGQARVTGGGRSDRGDRRQPGDARRREPGFDRTQQRIDLRFRWIRPFGPRDQVDLPAVQPLGDDASFEPAGRQAFHRGSARPR